MTNIEAYPLYWPEGWKRTGYGKWKVAAVQNIAFTLKDLGIELPIIL